MESLTNRFDREVFQPYVELLKSGYRFHRAFEHARRCWTQGLTPAELINGPYLERAMAYAPGESLEGLALDERTKVTIRKRLGVRDLYLHQTTALRLILEDKNAIIATGTSSGKTLCYQIPILDDLVRNPARGLRAVIIYPLNALVNDQLNEWEQILRAHPNITFARFTGQTPARQEDYVKALQIQIHQESLEKHPDFTQAQRQQWEKSELERHLAEAPQNRLDHREAIRRNPPHILITNFSMLEYLLERPVDAPIFEEARLKFLVLDEIHAYRGVQSTEIAFLIRRLKDRLRVDKLCSIGTSATLGDPNDPASAAKVRKFAADIFGARFDEPNPIRGTPATLILKEPAHRPKPEDYVQAITRLHENPSASVSELFDSGPKVASLRDWLASDENLHRLRTEILNNPTQLNDAAPRLFQGEDNEHAITALQALLELVAAVGDDGQLDEFLPARLNYFLRAQAGLHVCLHLHCPGRANQQPAFFVSRRNERSSKGKAIKDCPEGCCPDCHEVGRKSLLVEVVSCRKCGYLFGALQDLGPRYAQRQDHKPGEPNATFDTFSTELGWAADSFWSYFSVDGDLPFPSRPGAEEDDTEQQALLDAPAEILWCICCGRKRGTGGNNCSCSQPELRSLKIFHRQCDASDTAHLYSQTKKLLPCCPNCGARNSSGVEPLQRFQESEDETGMAIAIPLAHFQVTSQVGKARPVRKLLCFADHRQRAAAFPSLLEEEMFTHDSGRKIVKLVECAGIDGLKVADLGSRLFRCTQPDIHGRQNPDFDPDFFLPVSRLPDDLPGETDEREKILRRLWVGEALSYFGIPDSARESAEDLGLVSVWYRVSDAERVAYHSLLSRCAVDAPASDVALQVLLGFIRKAKAFTLPDGVNPFDPAFGRVSAVVSFGEKADSNNGVRGWRPQVRNDGTYRHNAITSFLARLTGLADKEVWDLAREVWVFLTSRGLLFRLTEGDAWQLDHERIIVRKARARHECTRCGFVTEYAVKNCCHRKDCDGKLEAKPFQSEAANLVARWVAGTACPTFTALKSEEHTAQINKEVAKRIEDNFRGEGVNLLSSTTTFEMGINIGDLQKVLLRNAPPTSASYVQRVGRAGRGKDKNAVCVTVCRRTKYDADAWRDPSRLMSGVIRPPTVFLGNRLIAQRHFNAVIFARFLRVKLCDEAVLGVLPGQKVVIEPMLPSSLRERVPPASRKFPVTVSLAFGEWLIGQSADIFFATQHCDNLLTATEGFDTAKQECQTIFETAMKKITDELEALLDEYQKVLRTCGAGAAVPIEDAITNILRADVIAELALRGFLPRYAFPLDVTTLETSFSRWQKDSDVELSRDRAIAISEFAPGAQVVARKQVFSSEGLYIVGTSDKPKPRYYARCENCDQVRTSPTKDPLQGPCPVCQEPGTHIRIGQFVEPSAFSVRLDKTKRSLFRKAVLLRQRQPLTHFTDRIEDSQFQTHGIFSLALKRDGSLFRYNLGPRNEGFVLCPVCGCSLPKRDFRPGRHHKRLRPYARDMKCTYERLFGVHGTGIAYGHEFRSYCLIVRPLKQPESVESLMFALQKALCRVLELDSSDIGVSRRWRNKRTAENADTEIILYDRTPGGAGFVEEGMNRWDEVVTVALLICESSATHQCEAVCYDCLKDFGNQQYHDLLDRNTVTQFFRG
ncbi:MAG: DEAD/DEAH box helicase [Patescibacteria group bacterium]